MTKKIILSYLLFIIPHFFYGAEQPKIIEEFEAIIAQRQAAFEEGNRLYDVRFAGRSAVLAQWQATLEQRERRGIDLEIAEHRAAREQLKQAVEQSYRRIDPEIVERNARIAREEAAFEESQKRMVQRGAAFEQREAAWVREARNVERKAERDAMIAAQNRQREENERKERDKEKSGCRCTVS